MYRRELTGINPVSTAYDFRIPAWLTIFHRPLVTAASRGFEVRVTNAQGEGAALVCNTPQSTQQMPSRPGIAVEPMTCLPDAFNSGIDLVSLALGHVTASPVHPRTVRACNTGSGVELSGCDYSPVICPSLRLLPDFHAAHAVPVAYHFSPAL